MYNSDRITSIVSDIMRNVFYTLHNNNTIAVYTPTANTQSIQHIQTLSNLFKSASEKAPGSPALTPQNFRIISLHVIQCNESRSGNGVQLMALATNGLRLYFSPSASYGYNYSYGSSSTSTAGHRPLTLIHVRLPPATLIHPDEQKNAYRPTVAPTYGGAQAPSQPTFRPYIISAIENSCYSEGLLVAAQEGDVADRDFLLCISPDLTRIGSLGQLHSQQNQPPTQQVPYGTLGTYGSGGVNQRPPLTEYATLLAIPGRTWSIASVPRTSATSSTSNNSPTPVVTNELAMQFVEDPKLFMILTNAGLTFVVKRRALDYLRAAIEDLQKNGTVQPIMECRDRWEFMISLLLLKMD